VAQDQQIDGWGYGDIIEVGQAHHGQYPVSHTVQSPFAGLKPAGIMPEQNDGDL
jgi:hypothetical protein